MKRALIAVLPLLLAACDQTSQQASPSSSAAVQEDMQNLPPIYMPLVDLNRKSQTKFAKDHGECRKMAEPQERAAREASARQQSGAAMQAAGSLVSMLPVPGISQAQALGSVASTAQSVGASAQAGGAVSGANAAGDYALVVNNCLVQRGYVLLRG